MAKIYSLSRGASFVDEVLRIAGRERVRTAQVMAVGGVDRLTLAYFNREKREYEQHEFKEFFEVAGISGNLTMKDGKPFLHAHGTFGRRDLSVIGGHLISAAVFPLMEVVLTSTRNTALRKFDDELGLNAIYEIR